MDSETIMLLSVRVLSHDRVADLVMSRSEEMPLLLLQDHTQSLSETLQESEVMEVEISISVKMQDQVSLEVIIFSSVRMVDHGSEVVQSVDPLLSEGGYLDSQMEMSESGQIIQSQPFITLDRHSIRLFLLRISRQDDPSDQRVRRSMVRQYLISVRRLQVRHSHFHLRPIL